MPSTAAYRKPPISTRAKRRTSGSLDNLIQFPQPQQSLKRELADLLAMVLVLLALMMVRA